MQYAESTVSRVQPARNTHLRGPASSVPHTQVQATASDEGALGAVACPLLLIPSGGRTLITSGMTGPKGGAAHHAEKLEGLHIDRADDRRRDHRDSRGDRHS